MDGQISIKRGDAPINGYTTDNGICEESDKRICRVAKLQYAELASAFSKLWYGFKINPYANDKLLKQLEKITNIPKSDIKIWMGEKRKLLNISWSKEEITEFIHKPSTCDCKACNIVYEKNPEDFGCYSFGLEMRDQFI